MKRCPQCGKTYDASWSKCMQCQVELTDLWTVLQNLQERLAVLEAKGGVARPSEPAPAGTFSARATPQGLVITRTGSAAPNAKPQPAAVKPASAQPALDLESKIGRVWMNRIGVVAILFGAAFFLKYAFDNRWIGELGRVAIGLATGAVLLGGTCHDSTYESPRHSTRKTPGSFSTV